jgi:hypothetical protein
MIGRILTYHRWNKEAIAVTKLALNGWTSALNGWTSTNTPAMTFFSAE